MNAPFRRLNSPGPIADAFLRSRAFIVALIGPVGSGKTMTAGQKVLRAGALQGGKADERGVTRRKARGGVIRESYPNIDANILKSWFNIVPKEEGKFNSRAPYTHNFSKILRREGGQRDGRPIDVLDMEVEFRAIGDRSVEEVTRGWEVIVVWIDEYDLQPADLLSFLSGRVGRGVEQELVVDPQIILTLNMPWMDNHAYKLLIERVLGEFDPEKYPELAAALGGRPLLEVFIQPGGLEPDAENIHNLPGGVGYYHLQIAANRHRPGYVDRMIHNKPVPMQFGQPVNPKFNYAKHVRTLEFDPRRMLILGLDGGLFAAATAGQRTPMGQLRTLRECVFMREDGKALEKIGPTAFGTALKTMLGEHFPDVQPHMIRVVCDPACFVAGDRTDNEHDWVLAVRRALGLPIYRAKSNSPQLRNEAIWRAQAEDEGYAVDQSCRHLIRGHLGGYHYRKAEIAGGGLGVELKGHLEIADTIYTHVCDAEQYEALEGEGVIADIRHGPNRRREGRVIRNDSNYAILGE